MSNCPQCEHHKETARMWRQEAYKFSGHPLNDEQGANMTDLRKAAEMALDKFEHLWEIGIDAEYKVELLPEIQALRQAIEQAEKHSGKCGCGANLYIDENGTPCSKAAKPEQEPVAWFDWDAKQELWVQVYSNTHGQPLYAAPPRKPWVGLTDDDVDWILGLAYAHDTELVKTVEAKLKDKNG